MDLTGKQRRFLRAQAHALKPRVWVGKQGMAPNLVAQVSASLAAHELIKVKLLESCPLDVGECADSLAAATGASIAQTIGRTVLLYRPHPEHPALHLPGVPAPPGRSSEASSRMDSPSTGDA